MLVKGCLTPAYFFSNECPARRHRHSGERERWNNGAASLIIDSEDAAKRQGLIPRARILGVATGGVAPRVMGIGPIPATRCLLDRFGLKVDQLSVIELNEAFASQAIAVLRELDVPRDTGSRMVLRNPRVRKVCAKNQGKQELLSYSATLNEPIWGRFRASAL